VKFYELRLYGVLGRSSATNFVLWSTYCSSVYTHPPTGVCCDRYSKEARSTERRSPWPIQLGKRPQSDPSASTFRKIHARDPHLVMGPAAPGTPVRFRVLIDGQPPGAAHGIDVDEQGNGTVSEQRMYQLIRQPKPIADRQFEIEFLDSSIEAFAFTFG
jgi:hypothetical protein